MVKKDKIVSLTYTLRDERGEIFEHTDMPISYLHGSGQELFDKIEKALEGRSVGDSVEVELMPAEGFGEHDPDLTFTDDIENVPPEFQRLGAEVEAENAKGETVHFVVTNIANGKLTIDANHPLAGQTVRFDVTVEAIRDATPEERRMGRPAQAMH
ncbi:MAG TPA: FKBP-type peptidyl-prolyl cis-trans isomerase [Acidiferrobacter sp.]|nr:FKBP-type peptidyl-prolyl cis-trans isomerase [Acidiferrobacter sp.]